KVRAPPGKFLESTSPTGVPIANRYRESKPTRVRLPFLGSNLVIADEYTNVARGTKTVNSVVANVVHSMEASHAMRSVNAAVTEGITNVLTIHDCYAAPAPDVELFAIIRRCELARMYYEYDPLTRLRDQTIQPGTLGEKLLEAGYRRPEGFRLPEFGDLDI